MALTAVKSADTEGAGCRGSTTLTQTVYDDLCDRLIGGQLAPGEKVPLRHIAEGLGVSVMPVREAVSRLVADGALVVSPNRAVAVPVLTLAAFSELTTVRIEIEGFAAEQAAYAHTRSDLARIAGLHDTFQTLSHSPRWDRAAALRANRDFHFAIYQAAELPTLIPIIKGLWLKTGPVLNLDAAFSARRETSAAEMHHGDCVAALRARDGAKARAAVRKDIETTAAFIASSKRLAR